MSEKMYVAFYKGRGATWSIRLRQWLTRVWTSGIYSHCELIHQTWDDEKDPFMDEAIEIWYGATTHNPNGVAGRELKTKKGNWDIYEITDFIDINVAVNFLRNKIGLKYDWLGIYLTQILPLGFDKTHRYFCSEYIAECLDTSLTIVCGKTFSAPATLSPVGVKNALQELRVI